MSHKARLIDTEHYEITGYDAFFGFLSGLCAGNYDVTDVLVDSTLKIGGQDFTAFAQFVEKINNHTFRIILTQGLNRQIRRMCAVFGYEVQKLKRIRIMNIKQS